MTTFSLSLLPGNEGDCLWLEYGDDATQHRVLIDCGRKSTYKHVRARMAALPSAHRAFELLVITHVDRDHIEGVLELLADGDPFATFGDIWFNGYEHLITATGEPFGVAQGEILTAFLKLPNTPWNEAFARGPIVCRDGADLPEVTLPGGLKLTLVSPTVDKLAALLAEWERVCKREGLVPGHAYEVEDAADDDDEAFGAVDVNVLAGEPFTADSAEANGSSIALVAEYGGKRVLLAADAHADVLTRSLASFVGASGKAHFDAVKVAHHGSSHNTSKDLVALIDCDTWLFSTNGSYFHHPSHAAVARIIKHGGARTLLFNYRSDESEVWDSQPLKDAWGYTPRYPDDATPGLITLDLL